jgi:hypothetical protein
MPGSPPTSTTEPIPPVCLLGRRLERGQLLAATDEPRAGDTPDHRPIIAAAGTARGALFQQSRALA